MCSTRVSNQDALFPCLLCRDTLTLFKLAWAVNTLQAFYRSVCECANVSTSVFFINFFLRFVLLLLQDLEEFSFVTQLAGITDHLSVAMRLSVSTGEEEP